MHRPTRTTAILLGLCALLPFSALAQEQGESAEQAAAMEAYQQAAATGEQHAYLAKLAGSWTYTSKMWMDPSQPPMTSGGASEKTMLMDGRYLQEETTGEFNGMPFLGRGITGFDNTKGELVGTWIDNMGTGILNTSGKPDASGHTLWGEFNDPASGQVLKLRMVTRVVDADHHVFEYYVTMPGAGELKQMELSYARKK